MKTASEIYTEAKKICEEVLREPCNHDILQVAGEIMHFELYRRPQPKG